MDPLSVTASAIAVLQAISGTGKGLSKLMTLRNAPLELQALYNEIEALRSLLVIVQSSIRQVQQPDAYEDLRDPLCHLLTSTEKAVLKLETTIEYQLRHGVEMDKNGLPKVSRTTWLRKSGNIEKTRASVRDARDNLSAGLQAINIHMSETTRQTVIQIQSISKIMSKEPNWNRSNAIYVQGDARMESLEHSAVAALSMSPGPSTTLVAPLHMLSNTADPDNAVVKVTTSIKTQQCEKRCPCQCHARTQYRSPVWLKTFIGQLLFSYHGTLRTTACNYPPCRQTPRKAYFTYYFPQWLAQKAFSVSAVSEIAGRGASVSINMPEVISKSDSIWHAILSDNVTFIQGLFSNGYSPHMIDDEGESLLGYAVRTCDGFEVAKFLIQQGARSDWQDSTGRSPAATALLYHPIYDVSEYNWDPEDLAEHLNLSSLHSALAFPFSSAQSFELVLHQDFMHINEVDQMGFTPLHWAAGTEQRNAVELLLYWKADVNARNNEHETPLHVMCRSRNIEIVKLLLDGGANVNARTSSGETPLFHASSSSVDVITLLVQRGADIRHQNNEGENVLHHAAYHYSSGLIDALIRHGADTNGLDHYMETPIHKAVRYGSADVVSELLKASKVCNVPIQWKLTSRRLSALHFAAVFAGVEVMEILSEADLTGLDPTQRDIDGDTPDDCFYDYRDQFCTIIREPYEDEEAAWRNLMRSACLQNNIDPATLGYSGSEDDSLGSDGSDYETDEDDHTFVDAQEEICD